MVSLLRKSPEKARQTDVLKRSECSLTLPKGRRIILTTSRRRQTIKVEQAISLYQEYHKVNSKKNTIDAYRDTLSKFCDEFGGRELESLSSEEVLSFLSSITEGTKQSTKHTRYSHVKAFFNFIKEAINHSVQNPCDAPMIKNSSGRRRPITGTQCKRRSLTRLSSEPPTREIVLCWN
jgi:hypothetical protein